MELTDKLYRSLTPKERLRACIAAFARDDKAEAERLFDTCQEKTYRLIDAEFGYPLRSLVSLTSDHERALYKCALGVTLGILFADKYDEDSKGAETAERLTEVSGQALVARRAAWTRFCAEIGISEEEIGAAFLNQKNEPLGMVLRAADVVVANGDLGEDEAETKALEIAYLSQLRDRWKHWV